VSINAHFLKKNLRFALRSLPLIWPRLAYNVCVYVRGGEKEGLLMRSMARPTTLQVPRTCLHYEDNYLL